MKEGPVQGELHYSLRLAIAPRARGAESSAPAEFLALFDGIDANGDNVLSRSALTFYSVSTARPLRGYGRTPMPSPRRSC